MRLTEAIVLGFWWCSLPIGGALGLLATGTDYLILTLARNWVGFGGQRVFRLLMLDLGLGLGLGLRLWSRLQLGLG